MNTKKSFDLVKKILTFLGVCFLLLILISLFSKKKGSRPFSSSQAPFTNSSFSEDEEKLTKKTEEEKWKDLHLDFKTNPELLEEWKNNIRFYLVAKEWLENGFGSGDARFIWWIMSVKAEEFSENDYELTIYHQRYPEWLEEWKKNPITISEIEYWLKKGFQPDDGKFVYWIRRIKSKEFENLENRLDFEGFSKPLLRKVHIFKIETLRGEYQKWKEKQNN